MTPAALLAASTAVVAVGAGLRSGWTGQSGASGEGGAPPTELAVPFLSQGRLLCGGAAAAMVERFYGRRGVYAKDYAALVRPSEGGIRTTDLARALEERGWRVATRQGEEDAARKALDEGVPPILLIRSGEGRYHYVVLVGWEGDTALVHDPLRGPARPVSARRLESLRRSTNYWTLVVRPATSPGPDEVRRPGSTGDATPRTSGSGEGTPLAPALRALRGDRNEVAEERARDILDRTGDPALRALSWQLIATARYRAGRDRAALEAWNEIGEPRVDLVVIEGLEALRWTAVAHRLPFGNDEILTARAFALGRRRLAAMPGVASARLGYRPLPDGTVEVHAVVAERPRWPSATALGASVGEAAFDRELSVRLGPLLAGGERWALSGRWLRADALARLGLAGPAFPLPGIATVRLEWRRQRFALGDGGVASEERLQAAFALGEWISPTDRVEGRLGLERWVVGGRRLTAGGSLGHVFVPDRLGARLDVDAWAGGGAFARTRIRAQGELPWGGAAWRVRLAGTWVDAGAPRSLWDGAGTGRVRDPLLRGRRLVRDGVIAGPVFGPRLVQASLERARIWRLGPGHAALVLFLDGARSWGGDRGDSGWQGSWGVQLEGALGPRRIEMSLGTGSGDWILSVRVGRLASLF